MKSQCRFPCCRAAHEPYSSGIAARAPLTFLRAAWRLFRPFLGRWNTKGDPTGYTTNAISVQNTAQNVTEEYMPDCQSLALGAIATHTSRDCVLDETSHVSSDEQWGHRNFGRLLRAKSTVLHISHVICNPCGSALIWFCKQLFLSFLAWVNFKSYECDPTFHLPEPNSVADNEFKQFWVFSVFIFKDWIINIITLRATLIGINDPLT